MKALHALTSVTFGAIHFTFQSAADLTAEVEGRIMSKSKYLDMTKDEVVATRKTMTKTYQKKHLELLTRNKAKLMSMAGH